MANGGDRARRLNQQGQADRIAGSNAASAGKINMASTLLEGAAMTARGWKRYKEGGEGCARAATSVQKHGAPWRGLRLQASTACLWPMGTARHAWRRPCGAEERLEGERVGM